MRANGKCSQQPVNGLGQIRPESFLPNLTQTEEVRTENGGNQGRMDAVHEMETSSSETTAAFKKKKGGWGEEIKSSLLALIRQDKCKRHKIKHKCSCICE